MATRRMIVLGGAAASGGLTVSKIARSAGPNAGKSIAISVASIADLRALGISSSGSAIVESYYGDGTGIGGGPFEWNPTSTAADNSGTIIQTTGVKIGRWIRLFRRYNIEDFGARPTTDFTQSAIGAANAAAFNNAIAAVPNGGTAYWSSGSLLITGGGLSWSKRAGFVCSTPSDYVLANLANTVDAVSFSGAPTDDLDFIINVAGLSNNCRDAISISKLISPRRAWFRVQCDPARYGLNLKGIENAPDVRYMSTTNFSDYPNQQSPHRTHVNIGASNDAVYGTNASYLWIDISGGGNGIVGAGGASDAGNIHVSGVIQGVKGNALVFTNMQGFRIENLHLEANSGFTQFNGCLNFTLDTIFAANSTIFITNCRNYNLKNVHGTLGIDSLSSGGRDINTFNNSNDGINVASLSHETLSGVVQASNPLLLLGGGGANGIRNLAKNGLISSWPGGSSAAPLEFSGTNVAWTKAAGFNYYRGNPAKVYAQATTSTSTIDDGPNYAPSIPYVLSENSWVSFMAVASANGGADTVAGRLYVFDGTAYIAVHTINGNGPSAPMWNVFRFSYLMPANATWKVAFRQSVATVALFIGGIAWARGTVSPKFLQ